MQYNRTFSIIPYGITMSKISFYHVHKTDPLSGATKCVKIDTFCAKCAIFDNSVSIM